MGLSGHYLHLRDYPLRLVGLSGLYLHLRDYPLRLVGLSGLYLHLRDYPLRLMGLSGLEPPTSRLSGVRSNRLSYKPVLCLMNFRSSFFSLSRQPPALPHRLQCSTIGRLRLNHRVRDGNGCVP